MLQLLSPTFHLRRPVFCLLPTAFCVLPTVLLRREVHAAQEVLEARIGARGLFQLCVFRLGFLQDGDVAIGVFPECEEILIGGAGLGEGVPL